MTIDIVNFWLCYCTELAFTFTGWAKKRGHSAFSRISRKLPKIWFLHTSRSAYTKYFHNARVCSFYWPTVLSVAPLVQYVVCLSVVCRLSVTFCILAKRLNRFAWTQHSFCIDHLLWDSTVGHPSNSWASCCTVAPPGSYRLIMQY